MDMTARSCLVAANTLPSSDQTPRSHSLVVDHAYHQIRGYDAFYGNPEYDNSIITNIRTLRRLLADEALALGITDYTDDWTIIPDAGREELPRQINGIDCCRNIILTALCLAHTQAIPLSAITTMTVAKSRTFLASSICLHVLHVEGYL